MIYNTLSTDLQNLLIYNYESSTKFFIILILLFVSSLYLFYITKKFEETENMFVLLYRGVIKLMCYMYLYTFPLMYVFFLYPNYYFDNLVIWLLKVYSVGFIFFTVYLILYVFLMVKEIISHFRNPKKVKDILLRGLKLK